MPAGAFAFASATATSAVLRERLLLDFGWRFHLGHATDAARDFGYNSGRNGSFQKTGNFLPAAALSYDDTGWSDIDLPHDWVISLPFKNDPSLSSKGFYPIGRSYPENSVGWYRRVFDVPAEEKDTRISIEFDGVYREALVVFNGYYIGRHRGGYDPFRFDVTDFVKPGEPNVLLLRVDATESDGWFYEGAGIYRHTWLVKTAPVHVAQWGTFVRSTVQGGRASLAIRTEVENHTAASRDVRVTSTVLDPTGKAVAKVSGKSMAVPEDATGTIEQQVSIANPALWSLEQRNMYQLVTEVEADGVIVDRYETRFGIRTLRFDADTGFYLNDKNVKIKGTCNHQDHAGLGVALPDAAQRFRVKTLQDVGCNAWRSAHNPPTPELLDACDEMGMLFLDETRMMSSNPEGIAQFEDLIRRDRNHPCVFMWNMGNEERESATETGLHILTTMKRSATRLDGSRPVTVAPPPLGLSLGQGGLNVSDVVGYNYADPQIEAYHNAHPGIPVMGTENVSAVATRGAYAIDAAKGAVSSYDPYTTTGRASAEGWWRFVNSRPWMPGGFVWTGFDYRGEPSPYQWPNINSEYGFVDVCGFPKDTYYYYQAWWTDRPVLHIFPHWNWTGLEGKQIAVWVHSNMERVELFQDGVSLGAQDVPKDSHLQWIVTYRPGVLEARGMRKGQQVIARRETVGAAAKLAIRVDRTEIAADGTDLAFITAEVQDAEGRALPITDNEITFRATGAGRILGTGNGDPTSHEPDTGSARKAFAGLCMGIVQATRQPGTITVEISAPGLQSATATVTTGAVSLIPQVKVWQRTIPIGEGVTGLWRPVVQDGPSGPDPLQLAVSGDTLFSFVQKGSTLTGALEGPPAAFGPATTGAIQGTVEGSRVQFKVGTTTYEGSLTGDRLELRRSSPPRFGATAPPAAETGQRPVIGPPPQGTDPSLGGFRGGPQPQLVLRRSPR
jgi:beta-galactosidase